MKKYSIADKLSSTIKTEVEKDAPSKDKFDFADTILNKEEIQHDNVEDNPKQIIGPQAKMLGFTLTKNDIDLIQQVKERCLYLRILMNRSEILRAAILVISELDDENFSKACSRVDKLMPGRRKS